MLAKSTGLEERLGLAQPDFLFCRIQAGAAIPKRVANALSMSPQKKSLNVGEAHHKPLKR
jgi:hypothetical protein